MNYYYFESQQSSLSEGSNRYNPSSSFNNAEEEGPSRIDIKSLLKLIFFAIMLLICLSFSVYFSETFLVSSTSPNSLYGMISNYFFNEIPLDSFRYLDSNNSSFIERISQGIYTGTWIDSKNSNKKGKIYSKVISNNEIYSPEAEGIQIFFRLIEGNHIDHWIVINAIAKKDHIKYSGNNTFSGQFISNIEYGENLDRPTESKNACETELSITFSNPPLPENITITPEEEKKIVLSIMVGEFISNCNLTFSFNTEVQDEFEGFWTITTYSIIVTLVSLFSLLTTFLTIKRLNNSTVYANSISMITIGENIIWNAYGCLCHFFLCISFPNFRSQFGIPAVVFFFHFSVMDIRLLYTLWSMKYSEFYTDPIILRRKLMQFYFMFYFIMFFSFFFVLKFYFNKTYIIFALLFTWIPQIVYNVIYHNKISLPLSFIFIVCISRIFPSLYFRGYEHNFFELSPDYKFISIGAFLLISAALFLYSQTLFGARWFLPSSFKKGETNDLYKTVDEMKKLVTDLDTTDCLICLCPIIEKKEEAVQNTTTSSNNSGDTVLSINESAQLVSQGILTIEKKKCNITMEDIKNSLFDFHEKSMNIYNKPLMITPCHHVFHANCLDEWFKKKKECPKCRQSISLFS